MSGTRVCWGSSAVWCGISPDTGKLNSPMQLPAQLAAQLAGFSQAFLSHSIREFNGALYLFIWK
jgi:hypothetical protein